ncbi:radical SAM/CxCxxxxC motif protein YfkAB [Gorillibacterium timonense]|uniref:radical SAM/CxCxxxxC motif protein YfkAB n=1 Tax=Gorillibacterium timonense TaxID=1689269 RepID=UPI00071D225F|nr:radical SAM/CxCxxxxC motif protein YfkAB [Gorillibacterium timonense]
MSTSTAKHPDPWDPIHSLESYGRHKLTSVELTVTNLCNMRCEHCAVGDALVNRDGDKLPLTLVLKRLEEVDGLTSLSLTGGEPSFSRETIDTTLLPLLRYAKERGLKTQINSNLTLDLERYELMAPYLDVLHITFNYSGPDDFHSIGFGHSGREVSRAASDKLYGNLLRNARALSDGGVFVSAETMINYRTWNQLSAIHRSVAELGCKRHEVHPMYPSAFAASLPALPLERMKEAIRQLLADRNPAVWLLFGTLPFFACSSDDDDLVLLGELRKAPNVTVRNDPDGRNRLNVSLFTGDIRVTDFATVPPLGNIQTHRLNEVFDLWLQHELARSVSCHCPAAACCGPNLLVADMYYKGTDFTKRNARVEAEDSAKALLG